MITDEAQYQRTLEAIRRFEDGLAHLDDATADLHPLARECFGGAYESELALLRAAVAEYDARNGRRPVRGADGVTDSSTHV